MKFILAKLFEDKSISKVFLVSLLAISLLLIFILGIFWVQQARDKFKQESQKIQEDFVETQEKILQHETQTLINYIDNERILRRNKLKQDISSRVKEAHSIATNIYNSCKNDHSEEQIKKLIKDALRTVHFTNDCGFFYINSLNGVIEMDSEKPEWEGKSKLRVKDVYGIPIVKNEIKIVKTLGEGYTNYSWQDEKDHKIYPKISFVKLFKPFNWYIGGTIYLNNYRESIKEKILTKITDLQFHQSSNIAVYGFGGTCLAHTKKNLLGQNLWNTKDEHGNKVIQELITRGTDENGGFISYLNLPQTAGQDSISVLIYAKAYKDWQWIISSSIKTKQLNESIQIKKSELKSNVRNYFLEAGFILLIVIILIVVFTDLIVKISTSGLKILTQFYQNAATSSDIIDISKLHFKEFKIIGEHANEMIVKRKSIEYQLNIETAFFEQLFENSPEAISITDNKSKTIKVNKQFTKLFGYTKDEINEVVLDSLLADATKQKEANLLNHLIAKGELVEVETIRKCKNGTKIHVSIMGNSINLDGEQIAIFGIYRDITERKENEKHLTQAKNKAEESDKLKSAFLANMSHEIRTPMNHIIGFTEIITSHDLEESDRQEYAELIKQSGNNLLHLINDIIDLSKIECKQIQLKPTKFSINMLLSELYEKFYIYKNNHKKSHLILKIQKTLPDEESIIFTDAERLNQLLTNIIENAIKFTNKGFVEFGYRLSEDRIEFFVKDTGIGIPQNSIDTIFQSFRQMDGSATRQYSGTGLGLTISSRLTELLKGTIRVESEEEIGTCFWISLPFRTNPFSLKQPELREKSSVQQN